MRNEKGITLIALVITIIVLLILAGISIAMLTGDNGLLTKSQTAVKDNAIAGLKDKFTLAEQEGMTTYLQKYYSETDATKKAESVLSIVTKVEDALKKVGTPTTAVAGTIDGCEVAYTAPVADSTDGSIIITYDTRKCKATLHATGGTATACGTYTLTWSPIIDTTESF